MSEHRPQASPSPQGNRYARGDTGPRVLVRRGLLDITHALWLSRLPGAPPAGNGRPAAGNADGAQRQPTLPPAIDPRQPDGR